MFQGREGEMTNRIDPGFFGACFVCGGAHGGGAHAPRPLSRRAFLATAVTAAPAAAVSVATPARAQSATPRPPTGAFVLDADWVLAAQGDELRLLRGASVVVRNGLVEEVREGAGGDLPRLRLPGQVLLPGFISGHTHVCSATPTRGIIEGGRSYARPLELVEDLSDDEMDALTAHNLAELIRSGCTTQVEMALSLRQAKSYVRVAKRWGVRGYPGGMVPGIARLFPIWFRKDDQTLTASVPGTLEEIADNLAFGREVLASGEGRLIPMMAPHATDTHTPETMAAILDAAKALGSGIHIHLSQSARETETVKRLWGATPAEWLERLGVYEVPVFAAHLSGLEWPKDAEVLKRHKVVYAHCPSAGGAGGGGGLQPYPEALAAGLSVNIGIDTHSNDYLENLKLAVILGRTRARLLPAMGGTQPVKPPTIWSAIEGATIHAANGLGRQDLGRIAPGARADLVSVDVAGLLVGSGATPPEPLNNLLYANGTAVRHVLTDGVFQVHDGRFVIDDEEAVVRRGGEVVAKIWRRLEAEDWFKPTPR